ncbi:hypothetical protein QBC46DRAFT_414375 [Diplogelasinospora grovesii]|uniref:Uncharacterized protein n=1 Tax=Diplogelasinospora grovesii TaxID=303347 RepID=A0AAN6MUV2_9PEZI|nr:hypothetical protein QBC46DRAFT_414375 [Diplogelasinospora grovesii]
MARSVRRYNESVITFMLYVLSRGFTRLSILFFYQRIFQMTVPLSTTSGCSGTASTPATALIIIFPLPFIARLQLSLKKRILASIMFAVGILHQYYDVRPVAVWSLLKIDVGIIYACLPSI